MGGLIEACCFYELIAIECCGHWLAIDIDAHLLECRLVSCIEDLGLESSRFDDNRFCVGDIQFVFSISHFWEVLQFNRGEEVVTCRA